MFFYDLCKSKGKCWVYFSCFFVVRNKFFNGNNWLCSGCVGDFNEENGCVYGFYWIE